MRMYAASGLSHRDRKTGAAWTEPNRTAVWLSEDVGAVWSCMRGARLKVLRLHTAGCFKLV